MGGGKRIPDHYPSKSNLIKVGAILYTAPIYFLNPDLFFYPKKKTLTFSISLSWDHFYHEFLRIQLHAYKWALDF